MTKSEYNIDMQPARYLAAVGVAVISGFFCAILSVLLIVGYLQVNSVDPINSPALEELIVRLNNNPSDLILRDAVRDLDLMSRNVFFTKQAQFRMGGYMLLIGVVTLLVSLKIVALYRKRPPATPGCAGVDSAFGVNVIARKYIGMAAVALFMLVVVIALTSRTELPTSLGDVESVVKPPLPVTVEVEKLPQLSDLQKNWPAFRGYNGSAIAVNRKNIPTMWDGKSGSGILWKTKIPQPGFNSPIIWEDRVFLAGANADIREVYCFNAPDGRILWQKKVSRIVGSPAESPEVTDDTGYAAATMATDGNRVYAIFANGDLISFTMDGDRVWGINLGMPDNHYGHSSSLLVHNNLLLVQYDHNEETRLLGVDAGSGDIVWDADRDATISWSSPILIDRDGSVELIIQSSTHLYSYAPETGMLYWSLECLSGEVAPSPAYADGIVYVANDMAAVVAVDGSGQSVWKVEDVDLPDVSSPLIVGDNLLLCSSFGVITCMERATGKVVWTHENSDGAGFYSSPILIGDLVYAVDMMGVTHIFKVDPEYREIASPAIGEPIVATPAFTDGRIYMRSNGWLYCIGDRP